MAGLSDIALIGNLTSKQGRRLNQCFGEFTAAVNDDGRVGVTPFTSKPSAARHRVFDEANAVRLKLVNVQVVPRETGSFYIYLYQKSLQDSLDETWVDEDSYDSLPTREAIKKMKRFEQDNAQWKTVFTTTIQAKLESGIATVKSDKEGALKVFAELIRHEEQRDATEFCYVKVYHWYVFDSSMKLASCLIMLHSPHQALAVIRNVETSRDRESVELMYKLLSELSDGLESENCGEVVHKKKLEIYSSFGMKMPTAILNFGRLHGTMGKSDLTIQHCFSEAFGDVDNRRRRAM